MNVANQGPQQGVLKMTNAFGKISLVMALGVSVLSATAALARQTNEDTIVLHRVAMTPGTYAAYSHSFGDQGGKIVLHRVAMTPGTYTAYSHNADLGSAPIDDKTISGRAAMTPGSFVE
jgi:hypothetical protein